MSAINNNDDENNHVLWGPCQHGMADPRIADGGDGLHMWTE